MILNMGTLRKHTSFFASILVLSFLISGHVIAAYDSKYADALEKTLLFFEAQRSGHLPKDQRVTWRGNSGLNDGFSQGVDLVGGYYDAGDNVKFGFPMAFSVTMLSWAAIDYEKDLKATNQFQYTLAAIRWGTNYFIKAHSQDNVLWCQVGNPYKDHSCWMRPEDVTTPRAAFKVDRNHPGSDVAGETAAAMAAASIAFKPYDSTYSQVLLSHAKQLFTFADTFRGRYDQSVPEAHKFYPSGGYNDELLWAATWLYRATSDEFYMKYLVSNSVSFGGTGWAVKDFHWSSKYAGVQTLMAKVLMDNPNSKYAPTLKQYKEKAEYFMCACMQKNGGFNVPQTPGGLLYFSDWANLHYVSAASFVLATYSEYLMSFGNAELDCPDGKIQPQYLSQFAKSQTDYILGSNPMGMSYLVGFGSNYPIRVHHRGASILPRSLLGSKVGCLEGFEDWFENPGKDPNILFGALVGGPNKFDHYTMQRSNYQQSEPSVSGTAPLVGLFAKFAGDSKSSGGADSRGGTRKHFMEVKPEMEKGIEFIATITNRWVTKGVDYYRHKVVVKNMSEEPIAGLLLRLENLSGPVFGLVPTEEEDVYKLPPWVPALKPGGTFVFVYVQEGPQAEISVVKHD